MAIILSGDEVVARLRRLESQLRALRRQRRDIERYAQGLESEGQLASTIATDVNAQLVDWASNLAQVITDLSAIPSVYQMSVKIGMPALYRYAVITYSDEAASFATGGVGSGVIKMNPESESIIAPFSGFLSNDVVSISNAEDASNNITSSLLATPQAAGANVIANGTFTGSATSWTISGGTGGTLAYSANAVAWGGASSKIIYQAKADMTIPWTNLIPYLVRFRLLTASAGTLSVGSGAAPAQLTVTAVGDHSAIILADSAGTPGLYFTGNAFTGSLDNVSCIPWTGLVLKDPLGANNTADTSLIVTLQER